MDGAHDKATATAPKAIVINQTASGRGDSPVSPTTKDRKMSNEWDASKVPPSRFQKRKGSIYAVPGSRDGHVDSNYAAKFHEKHAERGYGKTK